MNNRSEHFQYMSHCSILKKLARDKHTHLYIILYYSPFTVFFVVLFSFLDFWVRQLGKRWECAIILFFILKKKNKILEYVYVCVIFFLSRNLHTQKQFVVRPCFLNVCSFLFVPYFFTFTRKHTHTHTRTQIPVTYILFCFVLFFCISVWFICLVISWNILCGWKKQKQEKIWVGYTQTKIRRKSYEHFFSLSLSTAISTILYIIYI